MEDDRFERENRFARFVHWLDSVLETLRGLDCTEMTVGTHYHSHPARYCRPMDARNKGAVLFAYCSNPNLGRLSRHATIADIDIVAAGGEIDAGTGTQGDVI